jgi:hypothetical protein
MGKCNLSSRGSFIHYEKICRIKETILSVDSQELVQVNDGISPYQDVIIKGDNFKEEINEGINTNLIGHVQFAICIIIYF